uniref:Uncharacterized protein n=1 Tax=Ditylenchus dipsaci TaxID=166011 RepID=A0A915CT29_9BILA
MRYIAVFKPFKYRTIWRQPKDVLTTLSCILQLWIPVLFSYNPQYLSCYENTEINATMSQVSMDMAFLYKL